MITRFGQYLTRALIAAAFLPAAASAQQRIGPGGTRGAMVVPDDCGGDVAGFTVRAGYWIDAIQLLCRQGDGAMRALPSRGGSGGVAATFLLEPGEQVRSVTGTFIGSAGPYVYTIQFHTNRQDSPVFGTGAGGPGLQTFALEVPVGQTLNGIEAATSQFLNGLTLLVRPAAVATGVSEAKPAVPSSAGMVPAPGNNSADTRAPDGLATMSIPPNTTGENFCPTPGDFCTDAATGVVWKSIGRGGAVPAQALQIVSRTQRICRAYVGGPGVPPEPLIGAMTLTTPGCAVVVNGRALLAPEYEVLVALPPNAQGEFNERDELQRLVHTSSGRPMPATALPMATFHGEVQVVCIAGLYDNRRFFFGRVSASTGGCLLINDVGGVLHVPDYMVLGRLTGG